MAAKAEDLLEVDMLLAKKRAAKKAKEKEDADKKAAADAADKTKKEAAEKAKKEEEEKKEKARKEEEEKKEKARRDEEERKEKAKKEEEEKKRAAQREADAKNAKALIDGLSSSDYYWLSHPEHAWVAGKKGKDTGSALTFTTEEGLVCWFVFGCSDLIERLAD